MRKVVVLLALFIAFTSCEALKELTPPSLTNSSFKSRNLPKSKDYTITGQYMNYLENEGQVTSWAYQALLVKAIEQKNIADIKKYINLGANPNRGENKTDYESAVFRASYLGCKECLKAMSIKSNFNYSWRTCRKLPIVGAAQHSVDMMQHLIDTYGVNVNAHSMSDDGLNTGLIAIVHDSKEGALDFMLKNGADPNYGKKTAWEYFCRNVKTNNLSDTQAFIRAGANLNACSSARTVLSNAIYMERFNIAAALLEAGANANYCEKKMERGKTAMYYAIRRNNFEMAKLLLEKGANVNCTDFSDGCKCWGSSLEEAVKNNRDQRIVDLLLAHGAK